MAQDSASPFNRTIVELKHLGLGDLLHGDDPFNRTIVELKLFVVRADEVASNSFNRTIVELKHRRAPADL